MLQCGFYSVGKIERQITAPNKQQHSFCLQRARIYICIFLFYSEKKNTTSIQRIRSTWRFAIKKNARAPPILWFYKWFMNINYKIF